jgi:hypothetical protein
LKDAAGVTPFATPTATCAATIQPNLQRRVRESVV